jgi:curved DNA-binding protein CbpA
VTKAAGPGIAWYELLGVLPSASAAEIRGEYESKMKILCAENLAGASPAVLKVASRAQDILDTALGVLGDPRSREQYDAAVGPAALAAAWCGGKACRPVPPWPGRTGLPSPEAQGRKYWAA